ncbi:MAG: hypothetical protein HRT47_13180 [Candidatus Caenarcaniphilales bacterium]|nr:hypothetical protein [Candidatus Caenarcaniphilales bacterium]
METVTVEETIFYVFSIIAAIALYMVPFRTEYLSRKRNGELDPNKSFFDNYFNPPINK